jgi:hypothetical protein
MSALLLALVVSAPCRILGPVQSLDAATLAQINNEQVVYLDSTTGTWMRHTRQTPLLVVFNQAATLPKGLRLHLRNGASLPGHPGVSDDPDHITWHHPWLGDLQWPLERVSGIGVMRPLTPALGDVLELVNGDRLEGFCAAVGPLVRMELPKASGALETVEIPWSQVQALHLAQAHMSPPVGCSAFVDGTVVPLADLRRTEEGLLQHGPHAAALAPGLGAVRAKPLVLAFGKKVLPLAEATWTTHTDETLPMAPRPTRVLSTDPLRLLGKGTWRVDLPPGMTRLRARVGIPRHVQHLVAGELKVHVSGHAVQRVVLQPNGTLLDIDCTGADYLLLERTVGEHGEVGAVVDLTQGVLLGE